VKVKWPVGLGACVALLEHDRLGVMGATNYGGMLDIDSDLT
jgi:hypothetical protein